jgi:hypothetical protein
MAAAGEVEPARRAWGGAEGAPRLQRRGGGGFCFAGRCRGPAPGDCRRTELDGIDAYG